MTSVHLVFITCFTLYYVHPLFSLKDWITALLMMESKAVLLLAVAALVSLASGRPGFITARTQRSLAPGASINAAYDPPRVNAASNPPRVNTASDPPRVSAARPVSEHLKQQGMFITCAARFARTLMINVWMFSRWLYGRMLCWVPPSKLNFPLFSFNA